MNKLYRNLGVVVITLYCGYLNAQTNTGFEYNYENSSESGDFISVFEPGYVLLLDGTKLEGELSIQGACYNAISNITIKVTPNSSLGITETKTWSFKPVSIVEYGLRDNPKMADEDNTTSSDNKLQEENLMVDAESNAFIEAGMYDVHNIPYAKNTVINESSEKLFVWKMWSGTGKKHTEKSNSVDGFVNLKSGEKLTGELKLIRLNTQDEKYYIQDIMIKTESGKKNLTQADVISYGVTGNVFSSTAVKRTEINGFKILEDPDLVVQHNESGGYNTDFKTGFVELADGTVQIGSVMEKVSMRGAFKQIVFKDLDGNEIKFKGNILSHGYLKVNKPFNELPEHMYQRSKTKLGLLGIELSGSDRELEWNIQGYLRLIDGSTVTGKLMLQPKMFAPSNPCGDGQSTGPKNTPNTPPVNKIINDMRQAKIDQTENYELRQQFYTIKIKTESGIMKYQSDLVQAFGMVNVTPLDINKGWSYIHKEEKYNFHTGIIQLKNGSKKSGYVAYIAMPDENKDYGVYFAKALDQVVEIYPMNQIEVVNQDIKTTKKPVIVSSFNEKEGKIYEVDGYVLTLKDEKLKGKIKFQINDKLWFATRVIFVDEKNESAQYDQDVPIKYFVFNEGGKDRKFVFYKRVFCEVIKEEAPFYYFRNPFPTTKNLTSGLINMLIKEGMEKAAQKVQKEATDALAARGDYERAMQVASMEFKYDLETVAIYKKEYLLFHMDFDRGFVLLDPSDEVEVMYGSKTSSAVMSDLLKGNLKYLMASRDEQQNIEKIESLSDGADLDKVLKLFPK